MKLRSYFLIRHKPSDTFLPARVPATKWDFERPDGALEPRLFKSARAAKCCATLWAQGRWNWTIETDSGGWEYPSCDYQTTPMLLAVVPGRRREDLEVVECALVTT